MKTEEEDFSFPFSDFTSDEDFDAYIDTLTPAEAIEAISQRRGAEDADQYAQWRKAVLNKQRNKAQNKLNTKHKPFDPSRYTSFPEMKRAEALYNQQILQQQDQARQAIDALNKQIADIDQYQNRRNAEIAAQRQAENPLSGGIAQATEKLPINTLPQYIARLIATGTRLRSSDQFSNGLAAELGITPGSQEHRELLSILSNSEGMTPEQLAQYISENIEPEYRHLINGLDSQDIRNAIIDTIHSGVTSRRKAYDFIANAANQLQVDEQRYYEQQELQAEIDADTEDAIREYEELLLSSLTPDDLASIDAMSGDYWDEILAIQQYEQEAYNDYDTTATTTTPRNTQQGAESRAIQQSTQPSNTTTIPQDSDNVAENQPATTTPIDTGSTLADNEREGEQIYGNDRRGDSRYTPQWQDSISSQQELDENGHPFVLSSNGTTTFGEITENSGLQPAPIKLSEGYQDENNKGYGLAHIEANHGKQIRNAGFNTVEDFVLYVAQNYDEDNIRVGKRRKENGNTTYLIQVTDQYDNTLFIELSRDGSYWNVNSGGIFRKGYANKKETVVKTEPQQPNNAVSTGSSLSEDEKSSIASTEPNGEPTVSSHKDTTNSQTSNNSPSQFAPDINDGSKNEVLLAHIDTWKRTINAPIVVLSDIQQVNNPQARAAIASATLTAQRYPGWFDDDTIYIYLPHCTDTADIDRTILHECIAHYGVRKLFPSSESLNHFYDKVWQMMDHTQRTYYLSYPGISNLTGNEARRAAADEYIAHLAEQLHTQGTTITPEQTSIWQRIVTFLRNALRQAGINLRITDADINNILLSAYQQLKSQNENDLKTENELDIFLRENRAANERHREQWKAIPRPRDLQQAYETNDTDAITQWKARWETFLQQLIPMDIPVIDGTITTASRNKAVKIVQTEQGYKVDKDSAIYKAFDYIEKSLKKRKRQLEKNLSEKERHTIDIVKRGLRGELNNTRMRAKKETAPETESVLYEHQPSVVSSADGAKVLKNLDNTINEYDKNANMRPNTIIGDIAKALGAKKHGSNSQYATFEAVNGKVFTIRLANHNAKVSTFDNHNESEGISIVISPATNTGTINDGDAHVVEYFYNAIKLRKANGKPLVEILKSIKQSLYSGEYHDTTGLAERDEVNIPTRFRAVTELDQKYFDALKTGNLAKAERLVSEAAQSAGYNSSSLYQGSLAFNGAAPSKNDYYNTDEERHEAWDNGEMEGDMSLSDYIDAGIDTNDLEWRLTDKGNYRRASVFEKETIDNINKAISDGKRTIKIYRAVDSDIKENSVRNGDWITPSRSYAQYHITLQDWESGRIIEQEVSVDDIWWDGNDINEWGYDNGKEYAYQNTPNNRKLKDIITYDDKGNIIPLSQRFNPKLPDTRFRATNARQAIFVSNARQAVENIRQDRATPEQWHAMLQKNGGIKAGEDRWLGLSDWLLSQQDSITRQQILDFIDTNAIHIEETHYSQFGEALIDQATRTLEAQLRQIGWDSMQQKYPGIEELFEYDGRELLWSENIATIGEYEDFILDNNITGANPEHNAINETREQYTTPHLTDNHEIALTIPGIEPYNEYDDVHFGDAGGGRAIAWIRFGDTTLSNSNPVLVIDEIQSKRHQDGREKGYRNEQEYHLAVQALDQRGPIIRRRLSEISDRLSEISDLIPSHIRGLMARQEYRRTMPEYAEWKQLKDEDNALRTELGEMERTVRDMRQKLVPDAPFDKNWHELAFKRMLRYAAENGYHHLAWTTGTQQAERYDIGHTVSAINRDDTGVLVETSSGDISIDFDSEGRITTGQFAGNTLADVFGKELADKILNMAPGQTLSGNNLHIGGEGMKAFYDRMLPSFVSKYVKKWGSKVQDITLPYLGDSGITMHSVEITPQMRQSVMQGQTMFRAIDWDTNNQDLIAPTTSDNNTTFRAIRPDESITDYAQAVANSHSAHRDRGSAVAEWVDYSTRFRFIGEQGAARLDQAEEATTRLDNLAIARDMEQDGRDERTIKLATGWERGADNLWRYEMPDTPINQNALLTKHQSGATITILSSLIDDEQLFKAYPELYGMVVAFQQLPLGELGNYSPRNAMGMPANIILSEDFLSRRENPQWREEVNRMEQLPIIKQWIDAMEAEPFDMQAFEDAEQQFKASPLWEEYNTLLEGKGKYPRYITGIDGESTLAHEVQHAIQDIEGFARGGNERTADVLQDKARSWAWRNALVATAQEHPHLAGTTALEQILIDEYTQEGLQEYIPTPEQRIKGFNLYVRGYDNEGYENAWLQMSKIRPDDKRGTYRRLAGEVEARNVAHRLNYTPEKRAATLARLTEDVAREDQIFIDQALGNPAMGSRVEQRMKEIATHYQGRTISSTEQAIVDVFTGTDDNLPISVKTADGNTRRIIMRQGKEQNAGTKHSLFRHYNTGSGVINADDLLLIPEVIANGTRAEKGKGKIQYRYTHEGGTKYTVLTEIDDRRETFADFYTNRKTSSAARQTRSEEARDTANDVPANKDSERREDNKISSLNFSSEPNPILSKGTTNNPNTQTRFRAISESENPETENLSHFSFRLSPFTSQAPFTSQSLYDYAGQVILSSANNNNKLPGSPLRFRMTHRTEDTVTGWINQRTDLNTAQRQAVIRYIDTLDSTALQLATARWFTLGTIRIPDDINRVRQAMQVARKAKVDPLSYDYPMAILNQFPNLRPDTQPINPDDLPTLTVKQTLSHGITIYNVDDTPQAQQHIRDIIDTHIGTRANPWCITSAIDGQITDEARDFWKAYNAHPKRVAFRDGRIIAFFAADIPVPIWWDTQDRPHTGIPISTLTEYNEQNNTIDIYNPDGTLLSSSPAETNSPTRFRTINWDNNFGYTQREDGSRISNRALDAEENGSFTKGKFCTVYGVSRDNFNTLLQCGIIKNTEWHHTGANFNRSDFFSWADSNRSDGNTDYSQDIPQNSFAHIYTANKKTITNLIKQLHDKEWLFQRSKTKEYVQPYEEFYQEQIFSSINIPSFEYDKLDEQHNQISRKGDALASPRIRAAMHRDIDKQWKAEMKEKYSTIDDKTIQDKYNNIYLPIIQQNKIIEEQNINITQENIKSEGKEQILLKIANIFGLDNYYRIYNLSQENQIQQQSQLINTVKEKIAYTYDLQIEKHKTNLDKWIKSQHKKGNTKPFLQITQNKLPEFYVIEKEEMKGRYGWFTAKNSYNSTRYYSGFSFNTKKLFDTYNKKLEEIKQLLINKNNKLSNIENLFHQFRPKRSDEKRSDYIDDFISNITPSIRFRAKNKTAPETVSVQDEHHQTVVSSADGAKILKNIDNAINEYQNDVTTKEKTFIGNLAKALGAKKNGSNSQYATFEDVNGKVFTIRLANHNAKVSTFDNHNESEGISIVISPATNTGTINDGNAHIVEYFYDAIKLRKADGKPLVEILKSIKQSLYSGEYHDTTGLAERDEVNIPTRFRAISENENPETENENPETENLSDFTSQPILSRIVAMSFCEPRSCKAVLSS